MDLEIMALETGIEKALNDSPLPPEVKRLILVELLGKVAAQANQAIREQAQEVKEKDAESVQQPGSMEELPG